MVRRQTWQARRFKIFESARHFRTESNLDVRFEQNLEASHVPIKKLHKLLVSLYFQRSLRYRGRKGYRNGPKFQFFFELLAHPLKPLCQSGWLYARMCAGELIMLILSISVTVNVTCLTVTSLIAKSCQQCWPIHSYSFYKVHSRFEVWWYILGYT